MPNLVQKEVKGNWWNKHDFRLRDPNLANKTLEVKYKMSLASVWSRNSDIVDALFNHTGSL